MKNKCIVCEKQIARKKQQYCREHSPYNKGEYHYEWKGENVGYFGLHDWVEKQLGKSRYQKCFNCGIDKNITWANKSHQYKRIKEDWIPLCKKCHFSYDKQFLRERDYHGRFI